MLFGPEDEVVAVADQADVDLLAQSHAEQERALQGGEPAAEDEDLWLGRHGGHSLESIAACAAATRAIGTR